MIAPFTRPLRATRHCRHYSYERGPDFNANGPRCAAGVDLSAAGAAGACMPEPRGACSAREEYSNAEREAWKAACDASQNRLGAAIAALPAPIPLRTGGHVPCPNCGGEIRFDRWHRGASLACSTDGCCAARFNIAAGADWPVHHKETTSA